MPPGAAGSRPGRSSAPERSPTTTAAVGSACLAEVRVIETIEQGAPKTPFMRFGDRVRIEMRDAGGNSVFGAIDQQVVGYESPGA